MLTTTVHSRLAPASLRVLLTELVDYAGLFPPAGLDMLSAVANYASYVRGVDAWALARFVVPVSRLSEFESARAAVGQGQPRWHLSALMGNEPEAAFAAIVSFNQRNGQLAVVDAVETKASTAEDIQRMAAACPPGITTYVEIGTTSGAELLPEVHGVGARAKIRTGGVKPEMFPSVDDVAGFLLQCAKAKVAFKATAGLHHPIRCTRPLTYEANAPLEMMHGFLNVFLAAALAWQGASVSTLTEVLQEQNSRDFVFNQEDAQWRGQSLSTGELEAVRNRFAIAFGSCSFEGPLADLRELHYL